MPSEGILHAALTYLTGQLVIAQITSNPTYLVKRQHEKVRKPLYEGTVRLAI
jgi:hypothetical protein